MFDSVVQHNYLSTACYHKNHEQCQKTCEFCEMMCACFCHNSLRRMRRLMEHLGKNGPMS